MTKRVMTYEDSVHLWGRIWMLTAGAMMVLFPLAACLYFNAWPDGHGLLMGALGVVPMFWAVGLIETFTYVPMLGAGGSYLGFTTGNITNLKVPCALAAMDQAGVKSGTEEGDVISTIAIAVSSIVTTLVIVLFVVLLVPLTPIFENEALSPAFSNILPALFGGLAVVYISRNWKVAMAPLIFMLILFISVPSLGNSASVFVPVGAIIAIVAARILYKRGLLNDKKADEEIKTEDKE